MWVNSLCVEVVNEGVDVLVIFLGFVKINVLFNVLNGVGKL